MAKKDILYGARGRVWRAILALPRDATNYEINMIAGCADTKSVPRALRELEDAGYLTRRYDPVTGQRYIEILRRPTTPEVGL